jgi:aspartate-semialdehyde dehydrogenase
LQEAAGLQRVFATCLEAASWGGRDGIESLFRESLALFNQEETPEPGIFGQGIAFDCVPALGEVDAAGVSERELEIGASLQRLLAPDARVALSFVQVPAFTGFGASLAIETERPLDPALAEGHLGKAPGVERWDGFADGATLRTAAGRDDVLVSRVRVDPSNPEKGLLLWVAADALRLSAANAVALAVKQLGVVH